MSARRPVSRARDEHRWAAAARARRRLVDGVVRPEASGGHHLGDLLCSTSGSRKTRSSSRARQRADDVRERLRRVVADDGELRDRVALHQVDRLADLVVRPADDQPGARARALTASTRRPWARARGARGSRTRASSRRRRSWTGTAPLSGRSTTIGLPGAEPLGELERGPTAEPAEPPPRRPSCRDRRAVKKESLSRHASRVVDDRRVEGRRAGSPRRCPRRGRARVSGRCRASPRGRRRRSQVRVLLLEVARRSRRSCRRCRCRRRRRRSRRRSAPRSPGRSCRSGPRVRRVGVLVRLERAGRLARRAGRRPSSSAPGAPAATAVGQITTSAP